ncbi:MAG: LTA synthase family protein [Bacteroidales bacterium]|jgi:phosphoglycerol transferase MdoB-like AlkP superfamily enzyme
MSNIKKKIIEYLHAYFIIVILFAFSIAILKAIEFVNLFIYEDFNSWRVLGKALIYYWIVYSVFVTTLFPLYALLHIISKKTANITLSIIYGMLCLCEISLSVYASQSGTLLDSEIIIRPLYESLLTIKNTVNIYLIAFLFVLALSTFTILCLYLQKKVKAKKSITILLWIIILVSSFFIFKVNTLKIANAKPSVAYFSINKTCYCLHSCFDYIRSEKINFTDANAVIPVNRKHIHAFLADNPKRNIIDTLYPLERRDNIPNVLGAHFNESKTAPNVVIIVVESLGRDWFRSEYDDVCYMPFLDSLSRHGLYWKNCLTTSSRSYGAVPAITGSLPHGLKGFQFGNMPDHNSLLSVLKNTGYQTQAFYNGLFYFDCIAEYLIEQHIDYMSPFYQDYEKQSDKTKGSFWGYHDEFLFRKTIDVLTTNQNRKPQCNLIVSLTTHDELDLNNPYFKKTYEKAKTIANGAKGSTKKIHERSIARNAGFVYVDQCLKEFFKAYAKRPDFNNTIFVITGDHSCGNRNKNFLSAYHVPLIIWSPLLKSPEEFPALITHNDITPSLLALLKHTYHLPLPKTVHYISDGLNTSNTFETKSKMLFLKYSRRIDDFLYNEYIYHNTGEVYRLNENLDMLPEASSTIKAQLASKFDFYKYINHYVYNNNKLSQSPIYMKDKTHILKTIVRSDSIVCQTPENRNHEWPQYYLLEPFVIPNKTEKWNKIKITLNADIKFLDQLEQDEYMDLYFGCTGDNMKYPTFYTDKIVKFITSEVFEVNRWEKLNISKTFQVSNATQINCFVYIYYPRWRESNSAIVKNIQIKVEGIK